MNKQQLLAKCADLGISTEGLDTNAKLKAAIAAKEAELAEIEVETSEETTSEETASEEIASEEVATSEEAPAVYEDERGRKWSFKKTAPQKINIDGHPMTQAEIFANEDVIADLVYGNSSLLTQTF